MKLNDKDKEALMETAGMRNHVIRLIDHGITKAEQDLLTTEPEASALLAARNRLEGARALRRHIADLMKPADK
jgi:hypothetical protein